MQVAPYIYARQHSVYLRLKELTRTPGRDYLPQSAPAICWLGRKSRRQFPRRYAPTLRPEFSSPAAWLTCP